MVQDWFVLKGTMQGCIIGKNTSLVGIGIDVTVYLVQFWG